MAVPVALGEDTLERRRESLRFWWGTWVSFRLLDFLGLTDHHTGHQASSHMPA